MRFLDTTQLNGIESLSEQNKLWKKMCIECKKAYEQIRHKLPPDFSLEYEKCFFHDYIVNALSVDELNNNSYNVILILQNSDNMFSVKYCDVVSMNINLNIGASLLHARDVLESEIFSYKGDYINHEFTISGDDTCGRVHIIFRKLFFTQIFNC